MLDDFQALETEARRVALQLMGRAVVRKLNADHSDEDGPHLPCECGAEARFAGRRPKTFTTALGPLTLDSGSGYGGGPACRARCPRIRRRKSASSVQATAAAITTFPGIPPYSSRSFVTAAAVSIPRDSRTSATASM